MSVIKQSEIPPQPISINGQPPQSMSQKLWTHKIVTDKDMAEFHDEMTKGRDIMVQIDAGEGSYVMLRQFVPSKIALGGAAKDIDR